MLTKPLRISAERWLVVRCPIRASDIAKVKGPRDKNVTHTNGTTVGARSSPVRPRMLNAMDAPTKGALQPRLTTKGGTMSDTGKPIIVKRPRARAADSALIPESSIRAGGKTANQEYAIALETIKIAMIDTAVGDLKSETGAVTMGSVAVMTAS